MKTIKVTRVAGNQFRFEGARVYYCPAALMGTVSETVAIRAACGTLSGTSSRAPGDWPVSHCHAMAIESDARPFQLMAGI